MEYGLIGARLGHSYSKIIHEMLCGYKYDLCPLPTEEEARAFLTKRQFRAINVTIPYKKLVMEYCSYIDPRAKAIGAVNTVVNKNGLLYGYNTDYLGFAHLCDAHGVDFAGRTVLILGTGGTHNTTSAVARDKGAAKVLTVSRHPDPETGELSYAEAVRSGAQIVINTTPAGMYPNVGVCNLDVAAMPGLEAVVDVVYNPDKTELILRAEEAGVPVAVGGLEMLVAQAVYAAEYFLDRKFEDAPAEIRRITAALRRDTLNIALIGMPSSGKTTLGKLLAKQLGRTFVDLDALAAIFAWSEATSFSSEWICSMQALTFSGSSDSFTPRKFCWSSLTRAVFCCRTWSTFIPVTASIRRTPAEIPASEMILKEPMSPVRATCVPPQSSFEEPIDTTRTSLPYFSPNSMVAPVFFASSTDISSVFVGTLARISSLTSCSTSAICSAVTG